MKENHTHHHTIFDEEVDGDNDDDDDDDDDVEKRTSSCFDFCFSISAISLSTNRPGQLGNLSFLPHTISPTLNTRSSLTTGGGEVTTLSTSSSSPFSLRGLP